MIRSEHIKDELKILDEAIAKDASTLGSIVKAVTLVIKLLMDIRSNQVAVMKNTGVVLRTKPEGRDSEGKTKDIHSSAE